MQSDPSTETILTLTVSCGVAHQYGKGTSSGNLYRVVHFTVIAGRKIVCSELLILERSVDFVPFCVMHVYFRSAAINGILSYFVKHWKQLFLLPSGTITFSLQCCKVYRCLETKGSRMALLTLLA